MNSVITNVYTACGSTDKLNITMTPKEFIISKYNHLKNEDDSYVMDITLEDLQGWLDEYSKIVLPQADVSSSFSKVVIKNNDGVLKKFNDARIVPRTNNLLYVNGKRYQVTSNVFNYDEKTIYVWVSVYF